MIILIVEGDENHFWLVATSRYVWCRYILIYPILCVIKLRPGVKARVMPTHLCYTRSKHRFTPRRKLSTTSHCDCESASHFINECVTGSIKGRICEIATCMNTCRCFLYVVRWLRSCTRVNKQIPFTFRGSGVFSDDLFHWKFTKFDRRLSAKLVPTFADKGSTWSAWRILTAVFSVIYNWRRLSK
jgi:hypothetical protein